MANEMSVRRRSERSSNEGPRRTKERDRMEEELRNAIAQDPPATPHPEGPTAAVAAVFVPEPMRILFIQRAVVPGDPWSGQMAFPGGRHEDHDSNLLATAIRETREEVGLDLSQARLLGAMADLEVVRHVGFELSIRPFFFLLPTFPELRPNREVAAVHWGEVMPLLRGERDTQQPWQIAERTVQFPGYEVGDQVVWGLTYKMIRRLFVALPTATGRTDRSG